MLSKVAIFVGSLAVLLSLFEISGACMCAPSHPQESICDENSFIALVKIRSEAYVRVNETLSREKKSAHKPAGIYLVDKSKKFESNDIFDDDDYFETTIIPTASPKEEIVPEFAPNDGAKFKPYYQNADFLRYRIKLYKAYKGINKQDSGKEKLFIYTQTSDGLCGKKLRLKETYLIIGRIVDGRLSFSICDQVIAWNTLSKNERRNIRKNMENSDEACKAGCKVTSCPWSNCKPKDRYECTWSSKMEKKHGSQFHPANFLCQMSAKGRCHWNTSSIRKPSHKRGRRHNSKAATLRHQREMQKRRNLP